MYELMGTKTLLVVRAQRWRVAGAGAGASHDGAHNVQRAARGCGTRWTHNSFRIDCRERISFAAQFISPQSRRLTRCVRRPRPREPAASHAPRLGPARRPRPRLQRQRPPRPLPRPLAQCVFAPALRDRSVHAPPPARCCASYLPASLPASLPHTRTPFIRLRPAKFRSPAWPPSRPRPRPRPPRSRPRRTRSRRSRSNGSTPKPIWSASSQRTSARTAATSTSGGTCLLT